MNKKIRMRRRNFIKGSAALALLLTADIGIREIRKNELKQIITKHAHIEDIINPNGVGRIYLIGQTHYYGPTTATGNLDNAPQDEYLPYTQSKIFHLLHDLSTKKSLKVVIGEGMSPRDIDLSNKISNLSKEELIRFREDLLQREFTINFFREHNKETGYSVLKIFYPELLHLFGAHDEKENVELGQLDREMFNVAMKYTPTRADYENPIQRSKYEVAMAQIQKRKDALNDKRSRIYLQDAQDRADELNERDVAIVIGNWHLPLMAKDYKGKRRLYIIKAKSD